MSECFFCERRDANEMDIILENTLAYSRWDDFESSPGHAEVVPKRHVESYFDLTVEERAAMYSLEIETVRRINEAYCPDGYNIGINEGEAAGRTILHVHIHIIPRYSGDVPDPRGGIRNVIPGKGKY